MKARYCLFCLLLPILLSSCVSTQVVQLDVQEPAKISLPVDIAKIAIVNNTVAQPSDAGVNRVYEGKGEYEMKPLDFDSLSWNTIEMLGSILDESKFFNKVSIYNYATRTDDEWLSTINLPDGLKEEIFEKEGFDGIISIDRILFNIDQKAKQNGLISSSKLSVDVDTKVEVKVGCSVYIYNRANPLTNFVVPDSVVYQSSIEAGPDVVFTDIPQFMSNELSFMVGETLSSYFIPSWTTEYRLFYSESSRIREAYSYFNNNKWDEVKNILKAEYNKTSDEETKAKLAANITLVYEAGDKLDEALLWIQKAEEHLGNMPKPDAKMAEYLGSYKTLLQKRALDNKKLDIQYGVE